MMNRVPPQAQTYGFPPGGQPQQRAMAQPLEPQQQNKGTLVPGQVLRVGKIQVTVERYLSEGGFAHVYLVKTKEKLQGRDLHVLKRVAVRDRKLLDEVRREVEVMKLLRGHPNIVHLHDADAFHLPDGTHEVLILMEFCAGGGIIDLLNSRLQHRLSEQEILQIFVDVCEGVAKMHSLRPKPLVHRDLKVENILQAGTNIFKLCDFGSAAYPKPPPTNLHEIKEVELDINTHTTMQYRSPEMVDVYQRRPIDEKADIWALGVFLYKLCYYTTPFEEHGPLAILNVQYRVPPYPTYSNQLNLLIGSMLQEHGSQRPSAVQLLKTVHSMRGTKSPYHYDEPTSSQPSSSGTDLFDIISSVGSPPPQPAPAANITPMRRGRPTKAPGQASPQVAMPVANPNPPPTKGPPPQVLEPQYTIPAFPLDVPAQQTKPIINVTGEKTPATAVSVSAGSARAKSLTTDSWSSFGSFKGTTSEPSPQTGTFDGFADLEEPSIKPSKTASSRTSGFSAFIPPSAQNSLGPPPSLPPRKSSSSSAFDGFADSFTDSFVPLSSSPQPIGGQMLSPRPPSSATPTLPLLQPQSTDRLSTPISPAGPTREPSFDEKYPSVEELDLRSTSVSPLPTPPTTTPSSAGFMPHVGRSYTGSAGQPTPSITDREPVFPLPRSTQVTGMAMRDAESKPQTTFSVQRNDGDFSRTGEGETVKKGPPPPKQLDDWLTGDASPAQDLPSLRPTPSPQPAPAPLPVQPAEPTRPPIALKPASSTRPAASSVIKAPRSPPVKAAKPPALKTPISSSIMSDKWSPVEAVRAKLQGDSSTSTLEDESSDEEPAAPEDAFRPSAVSQKSPQIDISLPPAQSWKKPESTFARPSSTSSHKSTSSYAPSLASANAPRRLPTFDSESASGFLRGSTTLGRASTISSTSSARPRPRPQSLYSSSSFGGAADLFTSPPTLAPISDVTTSAATTPEPALTPTSPAPMPIIAPKPQRRTSISNVAQRYDRGSPLSVTADGRPTAGPTVAPNPATQRFAGTQNGSLSSSTAPGLSRSSTLAAKRDVLPLKNVTPEANGSQAAAPAGITPPRQDLTSQEETDAEERKSVKSLISRWNKQR